MMIVQRGRDVATVEADSASGRPTTVHVGAHAWPVTAIEAVRDETAAYAVQTGPRTVFLVRARDQRFRLVHLHAERRWTVEPFEEAARGLAMAA